MSSADLELAAMQVECISEAMDRDAEFYLATFYGESPLTVVEDAVLEPTSFLPSDEFPKEEYVVGANTNSSEVGNLVSSGRIGVKCQTNELKDRNDLSLSKANQNQQLPSPILIVKNKIKWGNNVAQLSAPQQVMDPCEWIPAFRLRTVQGLKDGGMLTSIPSDGLLLECNPNVAHSGGVIALSKDEFL